MEKVSGDGDPVEGAAMLEDAWPVEAVVGSVWLRRPSSDSGGPLRDGAFGVLMYSNDGVGHQVCTMLLLDHQAVVTGHPIALLAGCTRIGQVPPPSGETADERKTDVGRMQAAALELANTWWLAHQGREHDRP